MFLLLYVSKREYGQSYLAQQTTENSYAIGYHGVLGSVQPGVVPSATKVGTDGYGSGDLITPSIHFEGCIQSQDGDKALLELILKLHAEHKPETMKVVVADQYLIKVTMQWMQNWTTAALKGNHQAIHQGQLWLQVRDAGVQFITHLEGDYGDDIADVYSVCYAPWEYASPAKQHINKPCPIPTLLWTTMCLHSPTSSENGNTYAVVNTKEIYEIGNMSPDTVYGVVALREEVPILKELTAFIDSVNQNRMNCVIRLRNVAMPSVGIPIARHRTKVLSKPHRWTDSYSLGLNVPIIEEVSPAHKVYMAISIYNALEILVDRLGKMGGSLETAESDLKIRDITDDLIVAGKPTASLLTGPLSLKIKLHNGRVANLATNTELPPLNAIRAIAKAKGRIYVGHYNIGGLFRYVYIIQSVEGIGVYTPWLTKLEYA